VFLQDNQLDDRYDPFIHDFGQAAVKNKMISRGESIPSPAAGSASGMTSLKTSEVLKIVEA
jgi:hypothetical protein